jgi:hypothetical protein
LSIEEINVWGLQKLPKITKNRRAAGPKRIKVEVIKYGER